VSTGLGIKKVKYRDYKRAMTLPWI
jgi:hypothetical protein